MNCFIIIRYCVYVRVSKDKKKAVKSTDESKHANSSNNTSSRVKAPLGCSCAPITVFTAYENAKGPATIIIAIMYS